MSDADQGSGAGQAPGDVPASLHVPAPATPTAPVAETLYARAMGMQSDHLTRAEMVAALTALGHDAESITLVLNSLPGATPESKLLELRLDQSVNPIAPGLLSFTEMGLEGDRRTVALYWATLGVALNVFTMAMVFIGPSEFLDSTSSAWAQFAFPVIPWIGFPLGILALWRAAMLIFRRG